MSAIQFSIDEALLRDVDEVAKREHLDRSKLIRKALIRYLDEVRHAEREAQHRAGYEKYPQDASELADWSADVAGELAWGDIRLVELDAPDKMRPALVLTRTSAIPYLNAVTIAPITSTIRGIPTEIRLGASCGLKVDSAANFDCLQTVRKQRIGRYLGRLGNERRDEVLAAVCFAFGLADK